MRKYGFLRVTNSLIIIFVGISFSGCFLMRTTFDFKPSEQTALFSADYNPDVDNKLKDGIYLPYNESCRKFINGSGFCLFPDGRVEETIFYLDYLKLEDATQSNIERLFAEDYFFLWSLHKYQVGNADGIYTVKGNKLYLDIYAYYGLKDWNLSKSEYYILDDVTVMLVAPDSDIQNRIIYRCIDYPITSQPPHFSAKRQKWMWSNKEDWKNFKSEQKNKDQ